MELGSKPGSGRQLEKGLSAPGSTGKDPYTRSTTNFNSRVPDSKMLPIYLEKYVYTFKKFLFQALQRNTPKLHILKI